MGYIRKDEYDVAYNQIVSRARRAISLNQANGGSSAATVLILVSPDVDALCACKILISLLNDDCVGYKVVPVSGWQELSRINSEQVQDNLDLRTVILINLGSLVDLAEYFALPQLATLHVIDSHRPWNLNNVFASGPDAEQITVWDDGDVTEDMQEERLAFEAIQARLPYCFLFPQF